MPQGQSGGALVTTTNIVNDTIINEDVSSSAAIAYSKLNLTGSIVAADLHESLARTATVSVSSAEILALHTTPKTLIAAPGAGKIIVIDEVIYSFTVGTQYANGDLMFPRYVGDTARLVSSYNNTIINAAASSISRRSPGTATNATDVVASAGTNAAVELALNTATAFITGTGTLKVFLKYRIITL